MFDIFSLEPRGGEDLDVLELCLGGLRIFWIFRADGFAGDCLSLVTGLSVKTLLLVTVVGDWRAGAGGAFSAAGLCRFLT